MHVVATAGHVDHGKSTLVRALTGRDPDRLAEEHRRALSIDLGYAWTTLDGVGEVAFVDVPGHERFLTTTLAGVGPASVVMFVVAADDPWMPQAAEHLAALDALGVHRGVLVVTRADLADPRAALERARAELGVTSLAGCPATVVSGRSGAGLDRLRGVLAEVLGTVPVPDPGADVRLWIDRRFHVRGTGTVVTGTLQAGTIAVGDTLTGDGAPVQVRQLEALGARCDRVSGAARVAVSLGGRAPEHLGRGSVLVTDGAFSSTDRVDVVVRPDGGRVPDRPLLHIGTAGLSVHARPLGEGFHRLRLDAPLPLRTGDRAVLRNPGTRDLWGVRVLDPFPPPLQRRGAAAARAAALTAYDGSVTAELELRGLVRRSDLSRAGARVDPLPAGAVERGGWLLAPSLARRLRHDILTLVQQARPAGSGLTPAAAAHALELPEPDLVTALVAPPLGMAEGRIVDRDASLPAGAREALRRLHAELRDRPFAAPDAHRRVEIGLDATTVGLLHREGHVLRLSEDVVLPADAATRAEAILTGLDQPFTASQARQAWATTRRVALPLLRHLDATGRTVRLPDDRRRLRHTPG